MQVIKLGGSLSKSQALPKCLKQIATGQGRVVIVPGGGDFADQVRFAQQQWQFSDRIAHEMAILAMQQMALVFKGLQPNFMLASTVAQIQQALTQPQVIPIIWSPAIKELNQAGIAASWEITSDSLAAWLAIQLNASELILVKAAAVSSTDLVPLCQQGIIDKAFLQFAESAIFPIHILNQARFYAQSEFNC